MTNINKKKEIATKMLQHTHYDRKLGKYVKTLVPESAEHKKMVAGFPKGKYKEPTEKEKVAHQQRVGRAYSE